MKEQIAKLIIEKNQYHLNADQFRNAKLDEITVLLSKSAVDTITFLNEADEETISEIVGIFDDISYNLQNKEFVNCIESLVSKFPNLNIIIWVEDVKNAMLEY